VTEQDWDLDRRAFVADERDAVAHDREAIADERERLADLREQEADERERALEALARRLGTDGSSGTDGAPRIDGSSGAFARRCDRRALPADGAGVGRRSDRSQDASRTGRGRAAAGGRPIAGGRRA
jgi:hypothetical protein